MIPIEIRPENFTEDRYGIIVQHIEQRLLAGYPGRFDLPHFFREWRKIMSLGIGRAWEAPGAIIGVTFFPNLFTGDANANIVFWWATPEGKKRGDTLRLLATAESAAREHNCRLVCSAAYAAMDGELMEKLYDRRGYEKFETNFRKELK